jgi:hypothetical protein
MKPATFIVIAAALSSSLAFSQIPQMRYYQAAEIRDKTLEMKNLSRNPKSVSDFIVNIKYAFDHNLLLDDNFFKKENACDAFSIEVEFCTPKEIHLQDGTHEITLRASNFVEIFPEERILSQAAPAQGNEAHRDSIPAAQILIDKTIDTSGTTRGLINFNTRTGGPNFNETIKILNANLSQVIEIPPPGKIQLPITGPHGDETWEHEFAAGYFTKKLVISFHEDGTLKSMLVEMKEIAVHQ